MNDSFLSDCPVGINLKYPSHVLFFQQTSKLLLSVASLRKAFGWVLRSTTQVMKAGIIMGFVIEASCSFGTYSKLLCFFEYLFSRSLRTKKEKEMWGIGRCRAQLLCRADKSPPNTTNVLVRTICISRSKAAHILNILIFVSRISGSHFALEALVTYFLAQTLWCFFNADVLKLSPLNY